MTYAEIIRFCGNADVMVELRQKKCLRLERDEQGTHIILSNAYLLSDRALNFAAAMQQSSFLMKLEVYMQHLSIGDGPKVFRPTAEQMFALEKMRLNIEVKDFAMPFGFINVELPAEYKAVRNPEAHVAQFHHDRSVNFMCHNIVYKQTVFKTFWGPKPEMCVEDWFNWDYDENKVRSDLPVEKQETESEELIRRAVMNYCLLLDEVGIKNEGPTWPNEYSQLVKWCRKNNKHTPKNKAMLQAHPIIYGLKKPTELVRVVASDSELPESTETNRSVNPHSRRGHYRMQPCGPKGVDRKRIRIPATIVNKHKLLGGGPGATYRT